MDRPAHGLPLEKKLGTASRPALIFGLFASVCRFPPLFLFLPRADSGDFIPESVCLSACLLFPVLQLGRAARSHSASPATAFEQQKYAQAPEHRSRRGCRRTELDHSRVVSTPKFRFCSCISRLRFGRADCLLLLFPKIFPILFSAFVYPVHIISARATQVPRAARAPWRESSSLPLVRSQNSILPASRSGMLTARQKGQRQGRKDRQAGKCERGSMIFAFSLTPSGCLDIRYMYTQRLAHQSYNSRILAGSESCPVCAALFPRPSNL